MGEFYTQGRAVEVYFQCFESNRWERDLTRRMYKPPSRFAPIRKLSNPLFPRLITEGGPQLALDIVKAYSKRQLTNESDVLLAVSGILHNVRTIKQGSEHCWGLPVPISALLNIHIAAMWPTWRPVCFGEDRSPLSLWLGLGWTSSIFLEERKRRPGFPSWSWCGWKGPIKGFPGLDQIPYNLDKDLLTNSSLKLEFELLDGSLITWNDFVRLDPLDRQAKLSRFIHITTLTTCVEITHLWDAPLDTDVVTTQDTAGLKISIRHYDPTKLPTTGYVVYLPHGNLVVGLINGVYERLEAFCDWSGERFPDHHDPDGAVLRTIRLG